MIPHNGNVLNSALSRSPKTTGHPMNSADANAGPLGQPPQDMKTVPETHGTQQVPGNSQNNPWKLIQANPCEQDPAHKPPQIIQPPLLVHHKTSDHHQRTTFPIGAADGERVVKTEGATLEQYGQRCMQ